MKTPRVYTDTSVVGGCFDPEFSRWSNGLIIDFRLGVFRLVLSEIIEAEIEPAPDEVVQKYAELKSYDPEFVQITDEAIALSKAYLLHKILDERYSRDLLHIAVATVAEGRCGNKLELQTYCSLRQDTTVQCSEY
ncbi:MAG: hypothetical protein KF749_12835 [Bacteroidetes bacterium]|nr:hypothetical protein [Bacteroidota bacterium]MCW5894419.1 hypothetical protein [Bacteroidota bacterium]